jgi:hypothetical protein
MTANPRLDVLTLPYPPLDQVVVGSKPILALRQLINALPTDVPKPQTYFRCSHQKTRHSTTVRPTSFQASLKYCGQDQPVDQRRWVTN